MAGDTIIRRLSRTFLGIKLEIDIITDSLLDTVTIADPVKIDSLNYVLHPPEINRLTKAVK